MKMILTNQEMADALDALIGAQETGRLGYALARNKKSLEAAAREYMQLRAELFAKYGRTQGNTVAVVGRKNVDAFNAEMGDIPGQTTEVEIMTVDVDVFTSGRLTNRQMEALMFMVDTQGTQDAQDAEGEGRA